MTVYKDVHTSLLQQVDPEKAAFFPRFFKTGSGEYGEGDQFLGVTVPRMRMVAKMHAGLERREVKKLLESPWHEDRFVGLIILLQQFDRGDNTTQKSIYEFYLANTNYINNWDLVDVSCRDIVGRYLFAHTDLLPKLDHLAQSDLLWDRRIAMISTYYFLMKSDPQPTLRIAEMLLHDRHDLIQKAVGWMLRELGKRVDRQLLVEFIEKHHEHIGRTTLRYAIEHFEPTIRKRYLRGDFS